MPELSDNGEILRFLGAPVESVRLEVDRIDERTTAIESRISAIDTRMATKDDIPTVRGDIERLDLRRDGIDRSLMTIRLDTMDLSISRLRSAVTRLAKDQPEILKLLGHW